MSIRNNSQRRHHARKQNPWFVRPPRSKHKPHRIAIEGPCEYCRVKRADTRDHVVPRSVLRTYNATAPVEAPSVPEKWLVEVPCCSACNLRKGRRRLVPPSWGREVPAMIKFFGVPWAVWDGNPASDAFKAVLI